MDGRVDVDLSGRQRTRDRRCVQDSGRGGPDADRLYVAIQGRGSSIGKTPFQIRVNDCPAGFNRVEFGFYPAQGIVSGMPGTLQLTPGSTTEGIGVQLTDEAGTPVRFETPQLLTDYDRAVGGNYSIPITASYVQTAPDMRPGPVNAMMVVLLNYL